jgi:hypothetical protein
LKWDLHRDNVTPRLTLLGSLVAFVITKLVTEMTLKSALQDLSQTTLEAISGLLRRLEYLAGLRRPRDDYRHWGFTKVHGETVAKKALREAHDSVVSQVLCTPLSTLLEDVESNGGTEDVEQYLEGLSGRTEELLPASPGAGATRHLSSVLHALLGLERNRKRTSTRRAS